ncbi:hypothetical protein [Mycobacteroides abscessus]|uniref:hypothetical protein n=1 Tax=Mycobacteroides abscessus TaxID=36809 RepID=UPI0009A65AA8|nr:hypothetical protein [Mycobacteroides abscessus]MDM3950334.1 hypothetical protein [Mycobacteroides abscessus]SLJ14661.1 Uncharacterised protein [Mycobacteroides abscessus subsp. massiliense]
MSDTTPNVMQLNKVIDKVSDAMAAITATAAAAEFDLGPDIDALERGLSEFFTDRDARVCASAVLKDSV